jgi:hypothetical protein
MLQAPNADTLPAKKLRQVIIAPQDDRDYGLVRKGGNHVLEIRTNAVESAAITNLVCDPKYTHYNLT